MNRPPIKQCYPIVLALLLLQLTHTPQALAQTPDEWYQKGQAAYGQGQMDEALKDFEKTTQADPNNANAFFNIGAIQYNLKHYNEALAAFNMVLQIDPNDQSARYETARVYERLGRINEAVAAYEMITPESTRYQKAQDNITRLHSPATSTSSSTSSKTVTKRVADVSPQLAKSIVKTDLPNATVPSVQVQDYVTGLSGPTGVALDSNGALYVANFSKNTIDKVDTQGNRVVFASGAGINGPVGMAINHRTGNIYIANHLGNTVSQIAPNGKVTVIAENLKKPYNLFLDEARGTLYVSQQQNNSVAKIQLAN